MGGFRYWANAPFVLGCIAYAANRWLMKPRVDSRFLQSYFNDLWMIPCVLPPLLWLYRRLGLRAHDRPPTWAEILSHLLLWSLISEWIGPQFIARSTADPWDVVAYGVGAVAAGLWWRQTEAAS
jgi:hypothetical protein